MPSHSNSFGNNAEKDTAGCRAFYRKSIVIGDYYYILGLTQGIFVEESEGVFLSETGEKLTSNVFLSTIADAPVNENYFREQYIHNQQLNLENGFITQEEYDFRMANIDQYATIVH